MVPGGFCFSLMLDDELWVRGDIGGCGAPDDDDDNVEDTDEEEEEEEEADDDEAEDED